MTVNVNQPSDQCLVSELPRYIREDRQAIIDIVGFWPPLGITNVKDPTYGAVGDGVTDDTVHVQAAIDAVSIAGGGIVYIPYNVHYHLNLLTLKSNVTIWDQSDPYGRTSLISNGLIGSTPDNELLIKAPYHPAVILDIPTVVESSTDEDAGTDLVADATHLANKTVRSASHTFVAGEIGKYIYVKSGLNWTVGVYRIASVNAGDAILHKAAATVNGSTGGVWELGSTTRFNRSFGSRLFGLSDGLQITTNGDNTTEVNLYSKGFGRYYRIYISSYDDGGLVGILRKAPLYPLDVDGALRVGVDTTNGQSGMTSPALLVQGLNGQSQNIVQNTDVFVGMNGGTVTFTGLIPAATLVIGVTVRVTTLITGATSFKVGTGADADAWGTGIAVAAGTTTSIADFTQTSPLFYPVATDVILTSTGGNFSGGAVRVTVHCISLTPPTS